MCRVAAEHEMTREISRTEGDAADASFGVGAEFRQFGDVLLQPLRARVQGCAFAGSEQRCQGGAEEYKESEVRLLHFSRLYTA
jgi:hypothetical protein